MADFKDIKAGQQTLCEEWYGPTVLDNGALASGHNELAVADGG